jgi:hypothetical protein
MTAARAGRSPSPRFLPMPRRRWTLPRAAALAAVLALAATAARAQDTTAAPKRFHLPLQPRADTVAEPPASHRALNLTAGGVGLGIGNSRRVTGIRINAVDHQVERVNGLNLTLWIPKRNPDLVVNGAAVGLIGPRARKITGVGLGGVGVVTSEQMNGVAAGGVIVLSQNQINGIAVGGVAAVAEQRLRGIGVGGLAAVGDHGIDGIAVGGLVTLAEANVNGITAAGLLTINEGRLTGASLSPGVSFVDGELRGVNAAGVLAYSRYVARGIQVGAAATAADTMVGLAAAGLYSRSNELRGLSVASWNDVRGVQRGITIGIYNYARAIRGVQIGLLNYVRSNPKGLRLLPIFNTKF